MSNEPDLPTVMEVAPPHEPGAEQQPSPAPTVEGQRLKDAVLENRRRRTSRDPADVKAAFLRPIKQRGRVAFWIASAWIGLVVFCALFADLLPLAPYDIIIDLPARAAPRFSWTEPLGTDTIGRSVTSRLVFGARQTLIVGLVSVILAMVIGLFLGMIAGYFRGKMDEALSIVMDSILSIPALVLLLAVAAVGKRDISTVIIGLGLVGIPTFARLARAQTLVLADREYVMAARAMGASNTRIMLRELVPNVVLPLSSYVFIWLALIMVAEGSLSFLGLGIPPPNPSWGGMINDGRGSLQTEPYLVFVPATCLVFTVLAFTVVGDRARRRFDTRQSAFS